MKYWKYGVTGILLFSATMCSGVTFLHLDGSNNCDIYSLPSEIVLLCDLESPGNKIVFQVFVDRNGNQRIDSPDDMIQSNQFCDGLGWIYDPESPENNIPGDENGRDGTISTTLTFNSGTKPNSHEIWIIRVFDEDQSTASAIVNWQVPLGSTRITGVVRHASTEAALPFVTVVAQDVDYPDIERVAVTNVRGEYELELTAGRWDVFVDHPTRQDLKPTQNVQFRLRNDEMRTVDFTMQPYPQVLVGTARYQDGSPVEHVEVTLQHLDTKMFYHTKTDEQGRYRIGVEPGTFAIYINPYYSEYWDNPVWPDGYYTHADQDTIQITQPQTVNDITFVQYPAVITGTCDMQGHPVEGARIQGFAQDPTTKRGYFYRTTSDQDGSFSLGVFPDFETTVFAQKAGNLALPDTGSSNVVTAQIAKSPICQFSFEKPGSSMSMSGRVLIAETVPARDVYVVAYNKWAPHPDGHLIQKTDDDGYYHFDVNIEGSWQVGVYRSDFKAIPAMHYKYLSAGMQYSELNFILTDTKDTPGLPDGQLQLADFKLLPHVPNPIVKHAAVEFILPHKTYTKVDVLTLNGETLKTLVSDELSSGIQKVAWDGTDDAGNLISDGMYLWRIESEQETALQTITWLR